jgi:lysophospholipase L1-like esterase
MRRLWLALCLLLPLAAQGATNLATAPISRMNLPWWRARWETTLAQAKAQPDAKVIWLGDSITQYWQRQGTLGYDNVLPVWQRYYGPYDALDFGFVGDTTSSLIWRLDHGQVAGLHPKLAIILIGANNLGRVHWPAAMTVPGIEAVVSHTHKRLPGAHILLLGVLPSIRSAWVDAQTVEINKALAAYYADDPVVSFVNAGTVLQRDGKTDAALYVDPKQVPPKPALHPDAAGMELIAKFIQPVVEKYAG